MRGGQLDRRMTLLKPPVPVDDPLFGPQPVPEDTPWDIVAARIPAQKWDLLPSDGENHDANMTVADYPARVRVRYMRGVTPSMRVILHDDIDKTYEITSTPAEIGRREWLEFTIKAFSS